MRSGFLPFPALRTREWALLILFSYAQPSGSHAARSGLARPAATGVRRAGPLRGTATADAPPEEPPACASVIGGANAVRGCVASLGVPGRWSKVHDCERPNRWREFLDDEDCKAMVAEMNAEVAEMNGEMAAEAKTVRQALEEKPEDLAYTELVPHIATSEEFLAANARGARHGRMVVVKFYSKRCRTCLRIAAKYRRLALRHSDTIDCFETEIHDGRALIEYLGVTQVPSIQVYDGDGATRIMNQICQPSDFKRIESKVGTALKGLARHPRLLRKWTGEERMIEGLHKQTFDALNTTVNERDGDDWNDSMMDDGWSGWVI